MALNLDWNVESELFDNKIIFKIFNMQTLYLDLGIKYRFVIKKKKKKLQQAISIHEYVNSHYS